MNGVKNYLMYFICMCLLFLFLFFSIKIFETKNNLANIKIYALVNNYKNEMIKNDERGVFINYPNFDYEILNKEISRFINSYDLSKDIKINYNMNINENLITIFYD